MNQDFRDPLRGFADADVRFLVPERIAIRYGDVPCAVIGRAALIENKRQLGRARDLADLELLARHPRRD